MGWSDGRCVSDHISLGHLNTVVGPSNSCTADADFLGLSRGRLDGTWHRRYDQRGEWILTTLTSLYHQLFFPTPTPSFSLSQVNLLCIPLIMLCTRTVSTS